MSCGCRVHPFALRCMKHGTPNTWPKMTALAVSAVGFLGVCGFLFGGRDAPGLSVLAIVAAVAAAIVLKIASWWYSVPRD